MECDYVPSDADFSKYYQSEKHGKKTKPLSTLTFTYTFEYDKDCVFFAHFAPYTYSMLLDYLD